MPISGGFHHFIPRSLENHPPMPRIAATTNLLQQVSKLWHPWKSTSQENAPDKGKKGPMATRLADKVLGAEPLKRRVSGAKVFPWICSVSVSLISPKNKASPHPFKTSRQQRIFVHHRTGNFPRARVHTCSLPVDLCARAHRCVHLPHCCPAIAIGNNILQISQFFLF